MIPRRDFMKWGIGAAGVWAAKGPLLAAATADRKIPIALQLYSLRGDERAFPVVIEAVAKLGYDGVEFAGYRGLGADALSKVLDQTGLKCCGTHTALNLLDKDNFQKTVEFHQTLRTKFVIVPWVPESSRDSVEAIKGTADRFNALADQLKPHGLQIGYHAHGDDFHKIGDTTSWDLLFAATKPEVIAQMDMGNCLDGGGDPYAAMRKLAGRLKTVHLKEHSKDGKAPIGEGDVRWDEVFKICETTGGTEWYVVEQEQYRDAPIDAVAACIKNLRKMGK